ANPTAEVSTAIAGTVLPGIGEGTAAPLPTQAPPTAIPPLPSGSLPTELKYRVLEQFPDFFYCDPDYYPVARDDEMALALERFPDIQANAEEFQAILNHTGLSSATEFTDEQKLLIYQEHKKLAAIPFELMGDDYQFQIQTGDASGNGFVVQGLINSDGQIEILDQQPTVATCPICLAAGTQIDTPNGPVHVEDLQAGELVWTTDASGGRIAAPVSAVTRVPVPADHQMVRVVLEDGRELWASPGHPTVDGRHFGELQPGDLLDGSRIVLDERVTYDGSFTYDLLPSEGTGYYWANGILVRSTLAP
ncbi:MAG: Hint domain-containing protein, partial [Chloroflexota bacterium]